MSKMGRGGQVKNGLFGYTMYHYNQQRKYQKGLYHMYRTLMKSKIHRATITRTDLNYVGSITIDEELMEAANFIANERVQIVNLNNGERFETYVIVGQRGSGAVELNGAAARLAEEGDIVIIISYAQYSETECTEHNPVVVLVDEQNRIKDSVKVEQN